MEPDHRRVLLLATEPAAGLRLDDSGLDIVHPEATLQRAVDVVRALQRAVNGHAAVVGRDGDDRVVLDVELFLVTDAVLALEHEVGGGESGVRVALGDVVGGEDVLRDERIEHRRAAAR